MPAPDEQPAAIGSAAKQVPVFRHHAGTWSCAVVEGSPQQGTQQATSPRPSFTIKQDCYGNSASALSGCQL